MQEPVNPGVEMNLDVGEGLAEGQDLEEQVASLNVHSVEWESMPDPVLLHVMSFLDTASLVQRAARVCTRWRDLAKAAALWSNVTLSFVAWDCWSEEEAEDVQQFVNTFLFAPKLKLLDIGLQMGMSSSVENALMNSNCQIKYLRLHVPEYFPLVNEFLRRHKEVRNLTIIDQCIDQTMAVKICESIGQMRLSSLNLNRSQLLHHKGVMVKGLELKELQYCPVELADEIADTRYVIADLICGCLNDLKVVRLRAPYEEVFRTLAQASDLVEVDLACGNGILEFLDAAASQMRLKKLSVRSLPEDHASLFRLIAQMTDVEELEIAVCEKFPGFSSLVPMIHSLKSITLWDVSFVGRKEFEDLLTCSPSNLKEIKLSSCACSFTEEYELCRERVLSNFAQHGFSVTITNYADMDDAFDYGFKPIRDCDCSRKVPRWN